MCTSNFEASSSLTNYAKSKDGQSELAMGLYGLNQASNSYFQAQNQNNYLDAQANAMQNTATGYGQTSRDVIEKSRDQLAWLGYQSQAQNATTTNEQAYRGLDTNVGSAVSVRQGQSLVDQVNADNLRYNAMLQSFGYQRQELNAQQKSESLRQSQTNPWLNAVASLGTTALSLYAMNGMGGTTNSGTTNAGVASKLNTSIYPKINSIYNW